MSLRTAGSNFLAIEDDRSIGSFKTSSRRVLFNIRKNLCSKEVKKELIDVALVQVIVDEVIDDDLSLDPTFRNNCTAENTSTSNRRVARHMSTFKEDS